MSLKIYKIINNEKYCKYSIHNTYDSAIVAAESEEEAKRINPDFQKNMEIDDEGFFTVPSFGEKRIVYGVAWPRNINDVEVKYIGEASLNIEKGIILSSFNAG